MYAKTVAAAALISAVSRDVTAEAGLSTFRPKVCVFGHSGHIVSEGHELA